MTTPFSALNDIESIGAFIEETLPDSYVQPTSETSETLHNDRIDLMALRIYGTNHEVVLRHLIWANDWNAIEALQIWTSGKVIQTPQIVAVYYTHEQTQII